MRRATPAPDMALLLSAARPRMEPGDVEAAALALRGGVEWNMLIPLAQHHGLIPLLARHVTSGDIPPDALPADALETLRRWSTESARRCLRLTGALVTLLRDLDAQGIPVIPLKGPVLAQELYGSIALRRFNDLDLLFRAEDLPRAVERLRTLGYRDDPSTPAAFLEIAHRTMHHLSMLAPTGDHRVELHYDVCPPVGRRRYPREAIAERLTPLAFQGITVQTLPPEELLVYLCLHGANHAWERLEWVCGVSELLRSGRVRDWDRVATCAARFDGDRRVWSGVWIAHRLLGAPLPPHLGAPDAGTRAAAQRILDRFASDPGRTCDSFDLLAFRLRTDTSTAERLRRCWATFCTPYATDVAAVELPGVLRPAYALLRPLRLAYRHRPGRTA